MPKGQSKIDVREYRRGNKKIDNLRKLATYSTLDVDKQYKTQDNKCQTPLYIRKQTQIT